MQRIGILRGGVSPEYHFSIQTGANVVRALRESGYEALDMLLDRDGVLYIKGIPSDLGKLHSNVDLVWNALHGEFGEDGRLTQLLNEYGIPYTGSGTVTSAMAFNKKIAKEHAQSLGIHTPQSLLIMPEGNESVAEVTGRIYRTMAPPWVLKPLSGGGSIRAYFAFTPLELAQFVEESITNGQPFLVEQYIYGRETAVGVIDDFRGSALYTLPVVEVKSPSRGILTNEMRSGEKNFATTDSGLRPEEKEQLADFARKLHQSLGAKDYSQSEFIVDKHGKIWFIEINTHPHLTNNSPFITALKTVGVNLQEFVKTIIGNKKKAALS